MAVLVNNSNDGMSWGLYPPFFSTHGLDVEWIGALLSGMVADFVGLGAAIHLVAALALASGLVVARAMRQPRLAPIGASREGLARPLRSTPSAR